MKLGIPIIVFVGLIMMCITAIPLSFASSSSLTSLTIDGIRCDKKEHFVSHIHMHLDIFINGEELVIPSNIGIIPDICIYWMHTHDDTGVIHIESPEDRNFTIGEFFDIWGQTFDNSQIFDNIAGEDINNALNVYVNGKKVNAGTDFRQIPINAHDKITIVYGMPPDPIPSRYAFPEGL